MTRQNDPMRNEDVRLKNEKIILRAIQLNGGMSQSEAVALTGLKAPTVLRIFSKFEEKGLIRVADKIKREGPEKKGRKPVYYQVNPESHYVIGVEFWAHSAHVLVVDFNREPIYTNELELSENKNSEEVCAVLADLIQKAIEVSGIPHERIIGIGVGAPGRVNVDKGEIINYSRISGFTNFPLGERMEAKFGLDVTVANNAGVIAMNAYRRGVAKNSNALMTYLIRYGIGGAFITNGQLFSPLGKSAFEVGHTTVEIDGRECYCGAKGCLETYISEDAILSTVQERYDFSSLKAVDEAISMGNTELRSYILERVKVFAVSARDMFRILSPDGFLIITRYGEISKILAESVQEYLDCDPYNPGSQSVQVYADTYNALQAGFGACDLVFDEYFV